ncbi:MAG: BspA family leucine-rich repeat surface protein [Coriobacteriaceae bacterium]|nr:BspA family leucine-rich repeat surface protein [Coriobacteriaceae bacterium]MDD7585305.1 BspA family leucine-rich repeat surface protein [Coriobacteriaceae bacterium]
MGVPGTYAVFDPVERDLTFVRGREHDGGVWSASGGLFEGVVFDHVDDAPWQARPDIVYKVKAVRFEAHVRPTSCAYWFHGMASCEDIDLENLDTGRVTDMSHMFQGCCLLRRLDLTGLDTSEVTNMSYMFDDCSSLEECDLSGLDTSEVTDMSHMFQGCSYADRLDLTGLDTSNVTSMRSMLDHCQSASSVDLSGLDTGSVTDMGRMFAHCWSLKDLDLSGLDMRRVADASEMFAACESLERLDLRHLDLTGVRDTDGMFARCHSLRVLRTDGLATNAVSRRAVDRALPSRAYAVIDTDGGEMDFVRSSSSVDVGNGGRGVVHAEDGRDYAGLVCYGFEGWDSNLGATGLASREWGADVLDQVRSVRFVGTVRPYNTIGWFRGMRNLESVDLSGLDTSGVHDVSAMFAGCKALESAGVHVGDDVSGTLDMFHGCESLGHAERGLAAARGEDEPARFDDRGGGSAEDFVDWLDGPDGPDAPTL